MASLLQPTILGDSIILSNRICMGSMTRNRCVDDGKPLESTCNYYAQRARTGLIVAEGTFISLHGAEWPWAPMMYTQSHARAWKQVSTAVHQAGGKIFFQPWHPGRIQNENMPLLKESGYPVLAPSKIRAAGGKFRTLEGVPVSGTLGVDSRIPRILNVHVLGAHGEHH
jgi:2,4-dienoyl-CoA reductase-like NADH-dependent reductase (Old Yellow Enzyme family)